jgi:ribonuclease P protein component
VSRGHQTDFPAEQPEAQAAPRVPFAHGQQERPEGPGAPPRQGPQAPQRLSEPAQPPTDVNNPVISLERLKARREFLFVAEGAAERKRNLVVQARPRPVPRPAAGAGFTTTKKVGGAVIRNRARRRLREAARLHLPRIGLAGVDYVFIARKETAECPWPGLLDDMESALVSLRRRIASGDTRARPRPANRPSTKG